MFIWTLQDVIFVVMLIFMIGIALIISLQIFWRWAKRKVNSIKSKYFGAKPKV